MRLLSQLVLSTAIIGVVPATSALAADYDPPIAVDQASPYVPVEVGTGWYLRGDVGYNFEKSFRNVDFDSTTEGYHEDENPFSASVGVGYHFTDYLRADINLGYLPGNKETAVYDDGTTAAADYLSNRAFYGTANLYVDLGTYDGFTPYIGAGAGVIRSDPKIDMHYADATSSFAASSSSPDYSFAYTLNAGVSYLISKDLSLDVGYQYLSAPSARYVALEGLDAYAIRKGLNYQQVRVGLRYDLW